MHRVLIVTLIALCATQVGACADDAAGTGTVSVSLVGQAPSGAVYRLRSAIIMVQGPSSTTFWNTEEDLTRTSLSANVAVGSYTAFLQEGWHLERLATGQPPATVAAELLSPNPTAFVVTDNARTSVPLRFRVTDGVVDMDQGYDIVIDVEEATPAATICTSTAACGAGQTCCLAGFLGTCQTLVGGAGCPQPDLTVSAATALGSITIDRETFAPTSCALVEGCVDAPGDRRLLRFSTQTPNVGDADLILGDPTTRPGFEYSACHGHYHFEGYASYQLIDAAGAIAATGHKQAFCLMDTTSLPGTISAPRYHCGFQGISAGWSDTYAAALDCQWVDITDVPAGEYSLRITVNAEHVLPERDYANNTVEVPVTIPVEGAVDPLAPCTGSLPGGRFRDCGWELAAGQQAVACTPGAAITLGCCGAGTCAGDPVLRVCDGPGACTAATALASGDDSCGVCPQASFVCPASGVYTVLTGAFAAGAAYTCAVGP